jgi:hypothetical protein
MANVIASITIKRKWWFNAAMWLGCGALRAGLVKSVPDESYASGHKPAADRVTDWLWRNGLKIEAN